MTDRDDAQVEAMTSRYFEQYVDQHRHFLVYAALRPRQTVALVAALYRLPYLRPALSQTLEGRTIREYLTHPRPLRWSPIHAVTAVLVLPADPASYSVGASKQTLRRRVRAAYKQGIQWAEVNEANERARLVELANAWEEAHPIDAYRQTNPDNTDLGAYSMWLAAYARDGRPLLLAVTPIDGGWALLRYFRTLGVGSEESNARYLMTKILAEKLIERGVQYLAEVSSPVGLSNGLRHFQRMIGFRNFRVLPSAQTDMRALTPASRAPSLRLKWMAKKLAQLLARTSLGWRLLYRARSSAESDVEHPLDMHYGVETGGTLPDYLISPTGPLTGEVMFHYGCQPSCLRTALNTLPVVRASTFLDLGCGKGRALVVASEYPFNAVVGVELSPYLCRRAQENATVVRRTYPDRPPIAVHQGNVIDIELPPGDLVIYIYHAFGRRTLAFVLDTLAAAAACDRHITIIYENPVHADLIDRCSAFSRWHGEQVGCDYMQDGPNAEPDEGFVVWRSQKDESESAGDVGFRIVVIKEGLRANVVSAVRSQA